MQGLAGRCNNVNSTVLLQFKQALGPVMRTRDVLLGSIMTAVGCRFGIALVGVELKTDAERGFD